MKPLIVQVAVFILATATCRIFTGDWQIILSGNIAMFALLCFTALGHFLFTAGMAQMLPAGIPGRKAAVLLSGVIEPLLGLALLFSPLRHTAGILLVGLLVILLPANISAAKRHINYETGATDGPGPSYLWIRIPLQAFWIAWVLYFSVF